MSNTLIASFGDLIALVVSSGAQISGSVGFGIGLMLQWYVIDILILDESGFEFPMRIPWLEALAVSDASITLATGISMDDVLRKFGELMLTRDPPVEICVSLLDPSRDYLMEALAPVLDNTPAQLA